MNIYVFIGVKLEKECADWLEKCCHFCRLIVSVRFVIAFKIDRETLEKERNKEREREMMEFESE